MSAAYMTSRVATSAIVLCLATASALGPTAASAQDMRVTVVNRSSDEVFHIYVSPTWSRFVGRTDLLGSGTIRPGYQRSIDFDVRDAYGECVLDVQAETALGDVWRKRLDVCASTHWTLYDGD